MTLNYVKTIKSTTDKNGAKNGTCKCILTQTSVSKSTLKTNGLYVFKHTPLTHGISKIFHVK